jgi:two-component system KDP operon response regulator KdpE
MGKTGNNLRLLIVDDEKSIRKFLNVSLTSYGYQVSEAITGKEALESVTTFRPDVIILDLGLPDMDGIEVIENIRKYSQIPLIILSVRDEQQDKIAALDKGADDYLTKPFGIDELHARLRAVLRRAIRIEETPVFRIGKLKVDLARRIVLMDKNKVDLSPTEYDLLKILVLNAGKVMTHKQILKNVWNMDPDGYEGSDHLLRVTISNLRNKLEPDPTRPEYIITEPAIGYRLKSE